MDITLRVEGKRKEWRLFRHTFTSVMIIRLQNSWQSKSFWAITYWFLIWERWGGKSKLKRCSQRSLNILIPSVLLTNPPGNLGHRLGLATLVPCGCVTGCVTEVTWWTTSSCSSTPRIHLLGLSSNWKMFVHWRLHFASQYNHCWKSHSNFYDWEGDLIKTLIFIKWTSMQKKN